MFGILTLILIALPFIFQIIFGKRSIYDGMTIKFEYVCLISIALQLVLSYLAFSIFDYNFKQSLEGREFVCGMPYVAIALLILMFSALLVLTIIVQFIIKLINRRYSGRKFN